MSITSERIEIQESTFRRILRNRARRLLFRSRQSDVMDMLGLFEKEDPCGRRGGLHCLLGLRTDTCILCSGLVGDMRQNPMYDELAEKYGDPTREPELETSPPPPEPEKPTRRAAARKKRVGSSSAKSTEEE